MRHGKAFALHEAMVAAALAGVGLIAAAGAWQKTDTLTKLSQVKSEMRTMAVAMEAYYVQNNAYPPSAVITESPVFSVTGTQPETMINRLTTPIAFLSQNPAEPFNGRQGATLYEGWDYAANGTPPDRATRKTIYWLVSYPEHAEFLYPSIVNNFSLNGIFVSESEVAAVFAKKWTLMSPGPDGMYWFDQYIGLDTFYAIEGVFLINVPGYDAEYDPTNGLVSRGDIARRHETALPPPPPFNSAKAWEGYR